MDLLKSCVLGSLLSFTIALVIGSQGSDGGFLDIHLMTVVAGKMYWSWPLFLVGTGLSWAVMLLQR
ncbi:MAG: hypothetical protein WA985_13940 [Erythrobacter sp.]|uniref:hypothetical protein n=1 Tax=Erythrobacter sp. TaxID=1042 RepID=UPI003C743263